MITPQLFKLATGNEPNDDDLERCNCQLAGEQGHWYCGWNKETNKPAFFGGLDTEKMKQGYYRVDLEG